MQMKEKKTSVFEIESIPKAVAVLAIPSVLSMLVTVLYNMVDRMYIGHIPGVGDLALAGVGVCGPVVTMIGSAASLIGVGGAPLMSMRMGEGETEQARRILANCFLVLCVLSVALMAAALAAVVHLLYHSEYAETSTPNDCFAAVSATATGETAVPKIVCLTFDDGPSPVCPPQLLDGLKKRDVKVTFFVTGQNVESYPDIVKRASDEGHLIGNHTFHHVQLTAANTEEFKTEIVSTNEIIQEVTWKETSFIRPPYGSWDKKYEKELNMFPVLWDVDPLDWCSTNVDKIVRNVLSHTKENSIILMHDSYDSTVTAALQIVDILQAVGYEFVTVDEILFD